MSQRAEDQGGEAPVRDSELVHSIKLLKDANFPIEVGRIEVDSEGFLRARDSDQPLTFRFSFRGFDVDVLVESGDEGPVHLKAMIGLLPFTAESGHGRRVVRRLFAAVDRLNRGRLVLSQSGEITIEASIMPPKPRTPISIMASIATLLLEAKPYIELLGEVLPGARAPQPEKCQR